MIKTLPWRHRPDVIALIAVTIKRECPTNKHPFLFFHSLRLGLVFLSRPRWKNWRRRWDVTAASAASWHNGQSSKNEPPRKPGANVTEKTERVRSTKQRRALLRSTICQRLILHNGCGACLSSIQKGDNTRSYLDMFENFVDINEVPADKKLKLFSDVVGCQAYEELKTILVSLKPTEKTFDQVRRLLEDHFRPAYFVIDERCKFNR